jgi:hypothetical protein
MFYISSMNTQKQFHGRGATQNPPNRFERLAMTPELDDVPEEERVSPLTQFFHDTSKSIIAKNDSPDVPFEMGVNPYRGCEHG